MVRLNVAQIYLVKTFIPKSPVWVKCHHSLCYLNLWTTTNKMIFVLVRIRDCIHIIMFTFWTCIYLGINNHRHFTLHNPKVIGRNKTKQSNTCASGGYSYNFINFIYFLWKMILPNKENDSCFICSVDWKRLILSVFFFTSPFWICHWSDLVLYPFFNWNAQLLMWKEFHFSPQLLHLLQGWRWWWITV